MVAGPTMLFKLHLAAEGNGEEEEVEFEEGSTIADGPLGVVDGVLGIKVAVRPSVLTSVLTMVLVLMRNGRAPEEGGQYLGVLTGPRKHLYPDTGSN
jgi:hypothetical protein